MADGAGQMKSAAEQIVIGEIRKIQDELVSLGVRRERVNFQKLNAEQLNDFLESVREQLETRKRFLGVS